MKTTKYNAMISAFQCDLSLARDGEMKMAELDTQIKNKNERLLNDIDLLEELEYLLRHGKAEIHIVEE